MGHPMQMCRYCQNHAKFPIQFFAWDDTFKSANNATPTGSTSGTASDNGTTVVANHSTGNCVQMIKGMAL